MWFSVRCGGQVVLDQNQKNLGALVVDMGGARRSTASMSTARAGQRLYCPGGRSHYE
jgi:cell division ATPase FtsA